MVNFVPASAADNILRRNLDTNNNHQIAEAGFIVNIYFFVFYAGVEVLGKFEHS